MPASEGHEGIILVRFTRVRMHCRVSLESGNDRLEGTTQDLSLSGALVHSGRAYPVGTLS